jgi:regulator of RNase E activity RraA
MPGRPGFRVHPDWPRPSATALAAFGTASPAQIADSMGRLGAMDPGLKPIWPSPRVIGPAVTVWAKSADNLMMHKGLALCRPGDVLVINTQGNMMNAGFGEIMATTAKAAGLAAVIVDGVVRDAEAIAAMGMPVYARGLSPNGCEKHGPGEVGGIIACGGVAVRAGDIIVADGDGVTVVPLADAAEIAKAAQATVDREAKRLKEIAAGALHRPDIDDTLRKAGVL